jgi:GDP-4-dehydro-6-deoxy-D-mannose reductase
MKAMLQRNWSVTAAGIGAPAESMVLTDDERALITWKAMDITSQREVSSVFDAARPEVVLHLAGISHVLEALSNPGHAYEVNTVGTVRLLAEVQKHREEGSADPVVLVVGSAEQYGRHEQSEMPLTEEAEQRPLTLYAGTKAAQEVAALQACRSGVRVVCTRSFNHSGVGHPKHFLLPGLVARAMALPKSGGTLVIGNADTVRDFLHVSDVVDAYLSLLERGTVGEVYNVSSGEGTTVHALATAVLQRLGITAGIQTDPALSRPVDVPVLVGSNSKLRRATGWAPRRTRDDIIDELIHAATR